MKKLLFILILPLLFLTCKKDKPQSVPVYQEPKQIYIYSVVASPTTSESVTIKNNSGATTSISHWTLGDLNSQNAYIIPSNTVLIQSASITFVHTQLGFQINDSGETIYLKDSTNFTIDTWHN